MKRIISADEDIVKENEMLRFDIALLIEEVRKLEDENRKLKRELNFLFEKAYTKDTYFN